MNNLDLTLINQSNDYLNRIMQNRVSRYIFSLIPEKILYRIMPITSIMIEGSSLCNLKCPFCTQRTTKRKRNNLNYDDFVKIFKKLPKSISKITLHFSGESFINPELPKIILYLSNNGIMSSVSTNGTLSYDIYRDAVKNGLGELIFTLDGINKENHERHRVGSNFDKILENIKSVSKIKNRNTKIVIQTIITSDNEKDLNDLYKLSKNLGADELSLKTLSLNIAASDSFETDRIQQGKTFLPKNDLLSRYAIKNNKISLKNPRVLCFDIRRPVITSEGDVVLCCIDLERTVKIGNIFEEESFLKLWFSKRYQLIRNKALKKQLKICDVCNYSLTEIPRIKLN